MDDIILNLLEEADAHYELHFVANGEVVKSVSAFDLEEVIAQSRKLEDAPVEWATEELAYNNYESEVGVEEGVK